jgi:nucleoside-diphosphate kinase
MERTLIILKPDAVQRGLVGQILARFEAKGLKIIAVKMMKISQELAEKHYQEHKGKDFCQGLLDYITCGPVIVIVTEGPAAIDIVRRMIGPTDGSTAPAGTIRGDFGTTIRYNLVHGSDSAESAEREIGLFFKSNELLNYDRTILQWCWQR